MLSDSRPIHSFYQSIYNHKSKDLSQYTLYIALRSVRQINRCWKQELYNPSLSRLKEKELHQALSETDTPDQVRVPIQFAQLLYAFELAFRQPYRNSNRPFFNCSCGLK